MLGIQSFMAWLEDLNLGWASIEFQRLLITPIHF